MNDAVAAENLLSDGFLLRERWTGVLTTAERDMARKSGLDLAFDPAQGGWVLAGAPDALDDPAPSPRAALSRIALRGWGPDDLQSYHAMLSDPDLWRYMPEDQPTPFTLETARSLMEISGSASHHQVQAIVAGGVPVGQVRLLWQSPDLRENEAEVSYWLGRGHRGRGLAAEALRRACEDAFARRPGLARLVAFIHPLNSGSVRVASGAGFAPAGTRARDGWQVFSRAPE